MGRAPHRPRTTAGDAVVDSIPASPTNARGCWPARADRPRPWSRILEWMGSDGFVLLLTFACYVVFAMVAPGFASAGNAANIFTSCLPLLVLAVGQTVVMITGGIDLSVSAIVGTTSVLG